MAEDLRMQFEETKEKERNVGLFLVAILFGLIVGVGGNAFYDIFIKPTILMQYFAVIILGVVVAFIIKEANYAKNLMDKMEKKIKILEGGEN
jgi:H+/gluconate symporter-like permease